ncbi:MAG: lactonase family protein [Stellaceae bacterium]
MPKRRLTRRQTLVLGLAGVMLPRTFIGGGTAMAQNTPDTVVYVSNAGSKEIYVLAMNRDSGDLTIINKVPVPGTDKPSPSSMPMAVSPGHRFLYAALRSDNFPASSFAIDPVTGRLSHLATTPLQDSMAYIVTDRTGRYLLSASYPGNKLTINPIDDNGRIVEKPTQIIPDRPKAHCILVDPANKHVYATSLGADIIMEWKFDPAAGRLSPIGPGMIQARPGAGPRHLALHPNGRFLYLITETTDTIGAYAIDQPTATLTELQFVNALPADFKEQPAAADLHVTPDGRFLYGSERKTSTLAGYRIDPEKGTLSPIGHFPTEKTPRGFAIEPRGRFLLSVGLDSNAMTVYRIDPQSGALASLKQYPMGQQPNWIEVVDLH